MHRTPKLVLLATAFLATASSLARAQGGGDSTPPAAPPVKFNYEAVQATRGEAVYQKVCVACHELLEYAGPDFRLKWNGRPVFDLYDLLQTTMPDDNPGGLAKTDYADVSAYIMKLNGVPAGKTVYSTNPAELKKLTMDIPKQ